MSKGNQPNKNRKLGALVAYSTLAVSLVSLGVYVYRQQQQKQKDSGRRRGINDRNGTRSSNGNNNNNNAGNGQDRNSRASLDQQGSTRSSEAQASSLSRLGSKIARTVRRNRKVMTISLKNTIVWNPSPDPTTPNYGFVEGAIPLLTYLAENYNLHLILFCPPLEQNQHHSHDHGKGRVLTIREQDEIRRQQQLGQDREKEQILLMLRNAGLIPAVGAKGPKLIDPRQLLICETEEGIGHVVRHLESHVHIDAVQTVVEMVQGVVPKVVFVQKKVGHSRTSSNASERAGQGADLMTRSHIRAGSSSSGSFSRSGIQDYSHQGVSANGAASSSSSAHQMGDSFVEVIRTSSNVAHEPLASGYVTQAGKRGYVEVTDQLIHSSLNPEHNH
ncbi:hypothetical protein BG011_001117 [Mortierella polycephala]|uniref:Uncharacterized protein n=1 Tax=Mortierella polycephala TaxID=41804 RepID=A0A9P6TUY6_9FUNG|nr:hypothetical protein BG011_001117 [Mortierella polycephala]